MSRIGYYSFCFFHFVQLVPVDCGEGAQSVAGRKRQWIRKIRGEIGI